MNVQTEATMAVLEIPATIEALPRMVTYLQQLSGRVGMSDRLHRRLRLAAEEIMINVAQHASQPSNPTWITVQGGSSDQVVWLRISDNAPPFDPTAVPATGAPAQPWMEGGVGLVLVMNMVDHVYYRRLADRNETTLVLNLDHPLDNP